MYNAVHFGAGRIGRGFVGQLLWEAGCRTLFIDADAALVDALHRRGGYPLRLVDADGGTEDMTVGNVDALHVGDPAAVIRALASADVVSTAVGVNVLPRIAPLLAAGLHARAKQNAPPLNILLCENGWHVADGLRGLLNPLIMPEAQEYFQHRVGLVECVIGRMVPAPPASSEDLLQIMAEPYKELPVNAAALRGPLPPLPGLVRADNFDAYEARKLFLHNMGHAALAYAGWQAGHEFVWQCVLDTGVADLCRAAMQETEAALAAGYGLSPAALSLFSEDLMHRFGNRVLGDTVARVAADPVRKLGPHERLVGAARLCERHGVPPHALGRVINLALAYDNPADPSAVLLQQKRVGEGDSGVLHSVCGILPGSPLARLISSG